MEDKIQEYAEMYGTVSYSRDNSAWKWQAEDMLRRIRERNYEELTMICYTENKVSRKIFELETGIKMPSTVEGRFKVLREYCKESYEAYMNEQNRIAEEKKRQKEKEEIEQDEFYKRELDGFKCDDKLRRGRILKFLTENSVNNEFGEWESYRDAIRRWASLGILKTDCVRYDDFTRSLKVINKIEYRTGIIEPDGGFGFWEIGKTSFDYANYMIEKYDSINKGGNDGQD